MARAVTTCVVAGTLAVFAGCGSANDATPQNEPNDPVATRGCGPRSAAAQFGEFLTAVSARHRQTALRRVAPRSKLLTVTLYHGEGPGAKRVEAKTPQAVFRSFALTIPAGQPIALVAVGVGTAPFAAEYARQGGGRTLGVELVARIGSRVLSGKIGIDCGAGWMYLGAMQVARRLRPQTMCGERVRIDARRPILCRL